jgi:hypothetical protein
VNSLLHFPDVRKIQKALILIGKAPLPALEGRVALSISLSKAHADGFAAACAAVSFD